MRWTPCRQQLLLPDPPSRSQGPTQRELDELIEFVKRAKRTGTGGLVVATAGCPLLVRRGQLEGRSPAEGRRLVQQLSAAVGDRLG